MSDMKRLLLTTKQYVNTSDIIEGQLLGNFSKGGEDPGFYYIEQQLLWTNIIIREQGQATDKARQSSIIISGFVKIYFYGEKIRK